MLVKHKARLVIDSSRSLLDHGDKASPDVEVFCPSSDPSDDEQVRSVVVSVVVAFILFAKKLVISGVCDARVKAVFVLGPSAWCIHTFAKRTLL